ncbi:MULTISPECIES: response regulator transcription factor [Methylovorus]|jgi:DNA-binding response OmpR family regulator|uniref:Two component transcriptional regulator, winged helix family n=1 Tax=Methylovorus glucosotrophus (strain SIP3-4) TaxID=582744 RepID=C6XAU1_METGS|nr:MULTISPECIES: response regulator transcription factor [Methylovorus]ACT51711.1 two component transcriptional regulator, winged helix family [Methylovorus glucosotrophus SIP3-4]ADQ85561.1 two component transcriptional regulator, winged helix family [Methylovorus sp. MP688]
MRVLLVEDDAVLGDAIHRSLIKSGYAVDWTQDGQQADVALHEQVYDAVVLDLGLPRMDGLEVLRRLRQRKQLVPVVILSAREGLDDRVHGLDLGADDYLTKPFKLPELEARLRAQIRRSHQVVTSYIDFGPMRFDSTDRTVTVNGALVEFSQRELSVLEALILRSGRVVSKESLVENLCNWDVDVGNNAIEVYVHRLRKKLEPYGILIRTVRGLGYLLEKQSA